MGQGSAASSRPHREGGASLVEILVSVAIMSVAATVLVAALSTGAFAVRTSNRLTTATNLASSQLESIKAAAYGDVVAGAVASVAAAPYASGIATRTLGTGLLEVTVSVSYEGETLVVISDYKVDR